jgi:hypothetical protein
MFYRKICLCRAIRVSASHACRTFKVASFFHSLAIINHDSTYSMRDIKKLISLISIESIKHVKNTLFSIFRDNPINDMPTFVLAFA